MVYLMRILIELDLLQLRARGLLRRLPNGDLVLTEEGMARYSRPPGW